VIAHGAHLTPAELEHAAELKARTPEAAGLPTIAVALLLRAHDADREPLERAAAGPVPGTPPVQVPARRRQQLRKANNTTARSLAYRLGLEHAEVNRRLNAAIGVRSIKDATIEQLERRLSAAHAWAAAGRLPGAAAAGAGDQS